MNTKGDKSAPKRTDTEIPFEVTNFHCPEPHTYAFLLDTDKLALEGMHAVKVSIGDIQLVSGDGARPEQLVKEGLRFVVYRAGKGSIEYGYEMNGRSASIAMSADFTNPPKLRFSMALFSQPTEIGVYRLSKVAGTLTCSMFEDDAE